MTSDYYPKLAKQYSIGEKVWLVQGDNPACEIVDIHDEMVCLQIKGWAGKADGIRYWYRASQISRLHPDTNGPVTKEIWGK